MQCRGHPEVEAIDRCVGCAEALCGDCLVEVQGQKYCGSCKTLAIQGREIVLEEAATLPCKEANEALTYAILSIFCFGFVLGPVAITKAVAARRLITEDPRLTGYGKANAAIVIASVGFLLWIVRMIGSATRAVKS